MASRFKNNISFTGKFLEAARKRVTDSEHLTQKNTSIDRLAAEYTSRVPVLIEPTLRRGSPLYSIPQTTYLKDRKYQVALANAQCNALGELIKMSAKDCFAKLRSLQSEVIVLNNEVDEANIKLLGSWTKVHLNTFIRRMDFQLQYEDKSWVEDFKTSFSYPERLMMRILPGAGATLPIKGSSLEGDGLQEVIVRDAYLIDEKTDFGDTREPIVSTPARNIFLKNKTFRHIIVRREHDDSSRKYKLKASEALGYDTFPHNCVSTCTIQLELANVVLFNYIQVVPLSGSSVTIKEISYLSEAGEEVALSYVDISTETDITLLTEPVYARHVTFTFEQYAPITKSTITVGDQRVISINGLIDSLGGWTNRLGETATETVSGRVYDFSIENINLFLVSYENRGFFRSLPINVASPIGLAFSKEVESIVPTDILSTYGQTSVYLPDGKVLQEAYIGGKLTSNRTGAVLLDSIIPIPDTYPTQLEFLAPVGNDCRVKLFPDLRWTIDQACIDAITQEEECTNVTAVIETDTSAGSGSTAERSGEWNESNVPEGLGTDKTTEINVGADPIEVDDDDVADADDDSDTSDSCFVAGTIVTLADGTEKAIEDILIGEVLLGRDGSHNTVLSYDRPMLNDKKLYSFNGTAPFVTAEHPFMTVYGWASMNPIASLKHMSKHPLQLEAGNVLVRIDGNEFLEVIEEHQAENQVLYNFAVDGTHTYFANGYLVHNKLTSGGGRGLDLPGNWETKTFGETQGEIQATSGGGQWTYMDGDTFGSNEKLDFGGRQLFGNLNLKSVPSTVGNRSNKSFLPKASYAFGNHSAFKNATTFLDKALGGNIIISLSLDGDSLARNSLNQITKFNLNADLVTNNLRASQLNHISPYDRLRLQRSSGIFKEANNVWTNYSLASGSGDSKSMQALLSNRKARAAISKFYNTAKSADGIGWARRPDGSVRPELSSRAGSNSWRKATAIGRGTTTNRTYRTTNVRRFNRSRGTVEFLNSTTKEFLSIGQANARDYNLGKNTWSLYDPSEKWSGLGLESNELIKNPIGHDPREDDLTAETEQLCTTVYTFTTSEPHGYEIGDIVGFIAPEGVEINGTYFVLDVIDEYTFTINLDSVDGSVTITVTVNEDEEIHQSSGNTVVTDSEEVTVSQYKIPLPETYDYKLDANKGGELGDLTLSWTGTDDNQYYVSDEVAMENLVDGDLIISALIRGTNSDGTEESIVGTLYGEVIDDKIEGEYETAANHIVLGETEEDNVTKAFDDRYLIVEISDDYEGGDAMVADGTNLIVTFKASFAALDLTDVDVCTYNVSETPDPVEVYEDGNLLTIGVDYSVSIDNGSNYFDVWPLDGSFSELYKKAKAGRFYVRFKDRDAAAIYWIKYRVHKNQSLSSCEQVMLRNGRVTFDEGLKDTRGTLQSIVIARTNSMHPYVSPILREYTLMVQEINQDKPLGPNHYSSVDSKVESSQ